MNVPARRAGGGSGRRVRAACALYLAGALAPGVGSMLAWALLRRSDPGLARHLFRALQLQLVGVSFGALVQVGVLVAVTLARAGVVRVPVEGVFAVDFGLCAAAWSAVVLAGPALLLIERGGTEAGTPPPSAVITRPTTGPRVAIRTGGAEPTRRTGPPE